MNHLLIRGLRHSRLDERGDWRELVTKVIQGEWLAPAASAQTLAAERGLGILGQPYYFYVLRAEDSYGLVVFVFREAADAAWPADAMGATPFDSGGWWLEKIRTEPPLDTVERQAAFRTLDVPLQDWQGAFERYVLDQYDTLAHYLEGHAPKTGSPPSELGFTVLKGQPNTARAWTWEVRIPHGMAAHRLVLQAAYMTAVSRDAYLDWLWHGRQGDAESSRIHEWIEDHVIVPRAGELVVRTARRSIASEVANG